MSKLVISKKELESFSVAKFKDHEGCPDAIKLLYKRYGDRVDNLLKYKNDFLHIIVTDNKPHWPINFICNLLTEQYKLSFFEKYLGEVVFLLGSKDIYKLATNAFKDLKKNKVDNDLLEEINKEFLELNSKIGNPLLNVDSLEYKNLYSQIELLSAINVLLKDTERTFTRSMTSALTNIANIQSIMDLNNAADNQKLKSIAINLLEYSEIF